MMQKGTAEPDEIRARVGLVSCYEWCRVKSR